MRSMRRAKGFTLVELLVVMGIIAILVAISLPLAGIALQHAYSAGCSSRMRTLGIAFLSYASDNNGQFPGRVVNAGDHKWPYLLQEYVGGDAHAYVDPGDPVARQVASKDLISDQANNSSFFFNGFNDLGAYNDQSISVHLVNLTDSSNLILLGQKQHGSDQFYMDFVEGNQNDILNKSAYFKGANYLFADGSARYISLQEYTANNDDTLWLVDKSYQIPTAGH